MVRRGKKELGLTLVMLGCAFKSPPASPFELKLKVEKFIIKKDAGYISLSGNEIMDVLVKVNNKAVASSLLKGRTTIKIPSPKPKSTVVLIPRNIWGIEGEATSIKVPDFSFPQKPEAKAFSSREGKAIITWTGAKRVNIYRDFVPINTFPISATYFKDEKTESGVSYNYSVVPVEMKGIFVIEGEPAPVSVLVTDKIPPSPPPFVFYNKETGTVVWKPCEDRDVIGYNIYKLEGGKKVKLNSKLVKGLTYKVPSAQSVFITCVDSSGNESSGRPGSNR